MLSFLLDKEGTVIHYAQLISSHKRNISVNQKRETFFKYLNCARNLSHELLDKDTKEQNEQHNNS